LRGAALYRVGHASAEVEGVVLSIGLGKTVSRQSTELPQLLLKGKVPREEPLFGVGREEDGRWEGAGRGRRHGWRKLEIRAPWALHVLQQGRRTESRGRHGKLRVGEEQALCEVEQGI
jgi:hypothetical protein